MRSCRALAVTGHCEAPGCGPSATGNHAVLRSPTGHAATSQPRTTGTASVRATRTGLSYVSARPSGPRVASTRPHVIETTHPDRARRRTACATGAGASFGSRGALVDNGSSAALVLVFIPRRRATRCEHHGENKASDDEAAKPTASKACLSHTRLRAKRVPIAKSPQSSGSRNSAWFPTTRRSGWHTRMAHPPCGRLL